MSTRTSQLAPRRALRLPAVLAATAVSKTHLYRLIQQGKFPTGSLLSERVRAWSESEIDNWLAEKFAGGKS